MAYQRFIRTFDPLVRGALGAMTASGTRGRLRAAPGQMSGVVSLVRELGLLGSATALASPYSRLLTEMLPAERLRATVAALPAHATVGPDTPGGSFYAMWQAAYHQSGMWHPRGAQDASRRPSPGD